MHCRYHTVYQGLLQEMTRLYADLERWMIRALCYQVKMLEVSSNSRCEGNAVTRRGFCTSLGRSEVLRGWKATVVNEPLYDSI